MTRPASLLRVACSGLVVAALCDGPARAEPPPAAAPSARGTPSLAESLTGQAKEDYETARILFENGDNAGALVKFQHAYDLSTDPRLLWNMAASEKNLRHYVRVLRLIEQYLRDGNGLVSDTQRADAAAVLRTVHSLVSEVRVTVNEPDASIYVDDVLAGTSPLANPVLVDLGDHRLRVSKAGFREQVLPQHIVGATEVSVTVSLEREARGGRLAVVAGANDRIQVDGAAVGVGRWEGPLSAGTHGVRVTADGMTPYSNDLALHEGEARSLDVTLRRESSGISPVWWIVGGVVAAGGLGLGGYFLFRSSPAAPAPVSDGTISPGHIILQP